MYRQILNFIGIKSTYEKLSEYYNICKNLDELESMLDMMADEYTSKNEIKKSVLNDPMVDDEIKKSIEDKFYTFANVYNKDLSELLDNRRNYIRERSRYEKDKDVKSELSKLDSIKKAFLSGQISEEIFLGIMENEYSVLKEYDKSDIFKATKKQQNKVGTVMREFYEGDLKSGSGHKVTSRKQAQAIGMSEAGLSKAETRKKTLEEISKKHNVPIEVLQKQLKMGMEVEKEHTTDQAEARKIALDHIYEVADYYTKLKQVEGDQKTEVKKSENPFEKGDPGKTDFSTKEREKLSEEKHAMPDGSFPIRNLADLGDAIQSFGRASNDKQAAVKKFIIRRAKELGATEKLPEGWSVEKSEDGKEEEPDEVKKADYFTPAQTATVDNDYQAITSTDNFNKETKIDKAIELIEIIHENKDIDDSMFDVLIEKAKAGVYADNEMNRKLGRVGEKYGKDEDKKEKKDQPSGKQVKETGDKKKEVKPESGGAAKKKDDQFTEEGKLKEKEPPKLDVPNDELKKLKEFALKASEEALRNAIKQSEDPKIRAVAQEELNRRKNEEVATKGI